MKRVLSVLGEDVYNSKSIRKRLGMFSTLPLSILCLDNYCSFFDGGFCCPSVKIVPSL